MNQIKNLFVVMCLIMTVVSCQKEALTEEAVLTQEAIQALKTAVPDAQDITWALYETKQWDAAFKSSTRPELGGLTTTDEGIIVELRRVIPFDSIPRISRDYLNTHYGGYTTLKAEVKDEHGRIEGYAVTILYNTKRTKVDFLANGNFKSAKIEGGHDQDQRATLNDLPASIRTYLTSNYAGFIFTSAEIKRKDGTVKEYKVEISSNGKKITLKFNSTGGFVSAKEEEDHNNGQVNTSDIPQSARDYIAANYAGFIIEKAEKKSENNVVTYEVEIKNNITREEKKLVFNSAWVFVRVK